MSPITTESTCEAVREAHAALRQALDGMDYCLDWRPQPGEWSAREIASHLLVHGRALNQALRRNAPTSESSKGQPLLTPERREQEMPELLEELDRSEAEMSSFLAKALEQQPQQAGRIAAEYREHWSEHIRQLSQIRYSLGL